MGSLGNGWDSLGSRGHVNRSWDDANLSDSSLLGAVTRNVAGLATLIAGLTSSVERATVGRGAVAGNVAKLSAGVALHGLCLAVPSKVVGSTALVAGGRTGASSKTSTPKAAAISSTADWRTPGNADRGWVGACASQVTGLTAVVATAAGTGTSEAQSRTVGLNVAKSLAVIALLGLSRTREGALVGFVAWLLAVIAKAFGRRADLGIVAYVATLVASPTR